MGNVFRSLYRNCCSPKADEDPSLGHHGLTAQSVGVSALAHDILHFEVTALVPDGLKKHVVSSKKAQTNWYKKLLEAWKDGKPPPRTPEDASRLVIAALKRHQKADVEGLLAYYGLPSPDSLVKLSTGFPSSTPHGVKFELNTLPVDEKAVADGDTITVYVSTADPRESACVPRDVQAAALQRTKARAVKNYDKADALQKKIVESGYS